MGLGARLGRFAPLSPIPVAIVAGALWGMAFGRTPWIASGWLVLAPLIVLLGHRHAGRLAFLHGLAAWTVGLAWIPATLIGFGGLPRPVAILCLLLLASYLALYEWAFARLGRALWRSGGAAALLGLPALWVALEWLRAHLIGGFPWNLAAYAWVDVPGALPLSAWIGAYGVSFLVLFANVGVAMAVLPSSFGRRAGGEGWAGRLPRLRIAPLALALLLPLLLLGVAGRAGYRATLVHHIARMEAGDFGRPVRIIQPNLPIRKEWDPAEAYRDYKKALDLASESCEPGALVVLPESALWPFSYDRDPAVRGDLAALAARGCSVIWNGETRTAGEEIFNSAYLLAGVDGGGGTAPNAPNAPNAPDAPNAAAAPIGGALSRYDKRHLVPFGEFIPFSSVLGWVGRMARGIGEYTPGTAPTLLPWDGEAAGPVPGLLPPVRDRIGMAICYEVVYPEEVAELSRAGATLLATVTNDAWYGDTTAPHQHLRAARFRAAENRKALLRAALTGISALVAPDGSERQRVALGTVGVIRARVWGDAEVTPYARAPWLPPLLCSVGALFAIIRRRMDHIDRRSRSLR